MKTQNLQASQQETLQVLLGPLSIHPDAGMPVLLCMLVVVQSWHEIVRFWTTGWFRTYSCWTKHCCQSMFSLVNRLNNSGVWTLFDIVPYSTSRKGWDVPVPPRLTSGAPQRAWAVGWLIPKFPAKCPEGAQVELSSGNIFLQWSQHVSTIISLENPWKSSKFLQFPPFCDASFR